MLCEWVFTGKTTKIAPMMHSQLAKPRRCFCTSEISSALARRRLPGASNLSLADREQLSSPGQAAVTLSLVPITPSAAALPSQK